MREVMEICEQSWNFSIYFPAKMREANLKLLAAQCGDGHTLDGQYPTQQKHSRTTNNNTTKGKFVLCLLPLESSSLKIFPYVSLLYSPITNPLPKQEEDSLPAIWLVNTETRDWLAGELVFPPIKLQYVYKRLRLNKFSVWNYIIYHKQSFT